MIVGHKIEQYLTVERRDYGGHWEMTTHRVVTELHATKGWRKLGHGRHVQNVRRLPSIGEWRKANITRFEPARRPGDAEPKLDWIDTISETAREKAVMRHKVRRVEIARARNKARNEAEDRQLAAG